MYNAAYNIEKIVKYLNPYKDKLDILFKWNPSWETLEKIIPDLSSVIPDYKSKNPFESYITLKENLKNILHQSKKDNKELYKKICDWIIKDWGRIKLGNEKEREELITYFLNENPNFKRIASTSKVGSFLFPEKYIIYDSRVSYSLNWILFSQDVGGKYFPIPEGRNSKMKAYDMNVLIRLKNKNNYQIKNLEKVSKNHIDDIDKHFFVSENEAYLKLNNLICEINRNLWSDERKDKPYLTEMILFSIADKEIFNDIIDKINIEITG